ncbi:MAG TPA: hypothetical protein PLR69_11130, partial [Candidatus Limiplasma sp.]|nr:hypothetical protein [Candidatus Limiplasma sp.]
RVELMFPVKDRACREAVENVLTLQLADNRKSWRLGPDGRYVRTATDPSKPVNAQDILLADVEAVFSGQWFQHNKLPAGDSPQDRKAVYA